VCLSQPSHLNCSIKGEHLADAVLTSRRLPLHAGFEMLLACRTYWLPLLPVAVFLLCLAVCVLRDVLIMAMHTMCLLYDVTTWLLRPLFKVRESEAPPGCMYCCMLACSCVIHRRCMTNDSVCAAYCMQTVYL
jgi:hypothetical protein